MPGAGWRLPKRWRRYLRKSKERSYWPIYASAMFLVIWALLFPSSFSGFVWKYFWGPVVADVEGHPVDGIHEGYNPVNTLTYGLLLAGLFYYGWRPLRRMKIWFGKRMLLALSPLILAVPLSRVLEDASAYPNRVAYLFVSPIIYVWSISLGLFLVLFSAFLERQRKQDAAILSIIPYPFLMKFMWYVMGDMIAGYDLLFFISLTVLFMAFHFLHVRREDYEMLSSIFLYSSYVLAIFVYYAVESFRSVPGITVIPVVILLAIVVSALAGYLAKYRFIPAYFRDPLNLAIVFSHSLDGAATWMGVDYYGYGEKHVLAGFVTQNLGGFTFFLSKIALSFLLVYLLDAGLKIRDRNLNNLVKLTIILLGLGPGIRDMLRIALGV